MEIKPMNYPNLMHDHGAFKVWGISAPTFLISALVNNDSSGLTSEGKKELEEFIRFIKNDCEVKEVNFVSCDDNSFLGWFNNQQTQMVDAYFHTYE
jgi:hypothetical protein